MKLGTTLPFLSLFSLLVSADDSPNANAVVLNNCKDTFYLWSVGGSIGPRQKVEPGESYTEAIHRDQASGGVSIKITNGPNGLYDGSGQMNFAYTLAGERVYYDLSDVFGDPFKGHAVSVVPDNDQCPGVCWPHGTNPGGSQVRSCETGCDVVLTACSGGC